MRGPGRGLLFLSSWADVLAPLFLASEAGIALLRLWKRSAVSGKCGRPASSSEPKPPRIQRRQVYAPDKEGCDDYDSDHDIVIIMMKMIIIIIMKMRIIIIMKMMIIIMIMIILLTIILIITMMTIVIMMIIISLFILY